MHIIRTVPNPVRILFVVSILTALLPARSIAATEVPGGLLLKSDDGDGTVSAAPILQTDIRMDVTGVVARVRVTQRFANPTGSWQPG